MNVSYQFLGANPEDDLEVELTYTGFERTTQQMTARTLKAVFRDGVATVHSWRRLTK